MNTQEKLDKLAELQAQQDVMRLQHEEQKRALFSPELLKQIADLELEQMAQAQGIASNIADLTAEIKSDIITTCVSVKSTRLHAIFVKGRVTWDTKGVEGYALAHPELLAYRKEGEPSVSFRTVTK